jgi:hypothetical protein
MFSGRAQIGCETGVGTKVEGEHAATESVKDARGHLADSASPQDASRLAIQVEAHQAVEREVPLAYTCVGPVDLPIQREHEPHRVLGDGERRILRHTHDGHAKPRGRGKVNVVIAR